MLLGQLIMEIDFTGPYSWPKLETRNGLAELESKNHVRTKHIK